MTKKTKIGSVIILILLAIIALFVFSWKAIVNLQVLFPGSIATKPIKQTVDHTTASATDKTAATSTGQRTGQAVEKTTIQTATTTADRAATSSHIQAPSQAADQTNTKTPLTWGAYVGWQRDDLDAFEQKVGQPVNHQAVFVHWGNENEFPEELATGLKNENKTLIIFWEAMDYNIESPEQSKFSYDRIIAGDWDSYITSFAQATKDYGGSIILIPFEEANGDWYPWALTKNDNSAAKHIAAYRYLHSFFQDVVNVKFGWSVNHESVPDEPANDWLRAYPGDDYVDYVGVNGFNFGQPWQTFTEIFAPALNRLKNLKKPIYIFSFACADSPKKPDWIREALTKEIYQYPQIVGWNWFNENKEAGWRVDSNESSLTAFKASF